MASPSSAAAPSEPPSSPPSLHHDRSFLTSLTEDDDTKMADAMSEPSDRASRSGKSKDGGGRESLGQQQPGGVGGPSMIGKIRHLKKEDGEPLWRKDIQYDFLRAVFDDDNKVFTNNYETGLPKQCFADLYIDTMSRSTKTSKVLRDKLLSDREAAKGMAMVCLLVNIGRMNTTLNCKSARRPPCLRLRRRRGSSDQEQNTQSSPRCARSCAPTTPSPRCRAPPGSPTPTSSSRMRRGSSRS